MKNNKIVFLVLFQFFYINVFSQVGIGTVTPDASSILDLSSTTKGVLLPRMTTLQQTDLASPAIGLTVFNITTGQIETNKGNGLGGALWVGLSSVSGSNAVAATNSIIGTNDLTTILTTDSVVTGMTIFPAAGTYNVSFNAQYTCNPGNSTVNLTEQAVMDLNTAYNQLIAVPNTNTTHSVIFGNETLTKGVYSIAAAGSTVSSLILDAQNDPNAVFIFKIGAAFNTGAGTSVVLANGASASNVFWVTEGAIVLGANSTIKGTLIAHVGAISMGAGGVIVGRMYSTVGAIAIGQSTATISPTSSYLNLGVLTNLVAFTSNGAVSNTGSSTITGDIGSHQGLISGFGTAILNGTIYSPASAPVSFDNNLIGSFEIYQNGVLIPNSIRTIKTNVLKEDSISLQTVATITTGQAIDVRWKTNLGALKVTNRILTILKNQ
jgi:hypothetical protein